MTRQLVEQSEVKLLRRDGTGPNTIPCGERKWRMSGTDVAHLLMAIDTEILKSIVVAESNLPPDVRDLEEIMRPTIIAWRNSPKDKRGVYGGVPENVPAGEPQTAYNLLRWLGHCGGTKNGILRKLYWAIFAADDTLVAKGHGMKEFLDMFGTKNTRVYQRLVSCVEVGQRTIFNPSTPTDISPADAPFLVKRHSGVGFDELEQPDSDLFTKLITEYPSPPTFTRNSHSIPWIIIDNSSGSSSTLVAKGRGQQAFFDMFGTKNTSVYQRLVSSVELAKKQNSIPLLQQTFHQQIHHF